MTWQPEQGWRWLAGRWAVAAGAGAVLGGALWLGEPGPSGSTLALDPTSTREVVLDPQEQAELSILIPAAGAPEDASDADEEDGQDRREPDSSGPGADVEPDSGSGEDGGSGEGDDGSAEPDPSDEPDASGPDDAEADEGAAADEDGGDQGSDDGDSGEELRDEDED